MSTPAELDVLAGDPVFAIAFEVFSALVDQGETSLVRSATPWADVDEVVYAWVDMAGSTRGRAVLRTDAATARDLARALLGMDAGAPVSESDLVDAVGEVANVVGGNLKSLLPDAGALSLPQVGDQAPSAEGGRLLCDLVLDWRGRQLAVAVWHLG